jgi:putative ABC transport system permease protein
MLRATITGMLAHRVRLLLTATSIALGVAFLAGTLMLTESMQRAFDDLFQTVNSGTDSVVRSSTVPGTGDTETRQPVPAAVLDGVRGVDGVAVAEGSVQGYALLTDSHGKAIQPGGAPTLGGNLSSDAALRGDVSFRSGRAPEAEDEVAIDASSARKGDIAVGSPIQILFRGPAETFTVVGTVGFGSEDDLGGSTAAYFDLATAQRVLDKGDAFDSIVVKGDGTEADSVLSGRIAATLPPGLEALTGEAVADEAAAAVNDDLGFLRIALMAFAGIALFVGSFIIWNTFSMQVAQRTRELALFRAIGATRGQVMRTILAEALVLGVGSSIVGIGLGVLMARGLSALMSGFGLELPTAGIRLSPSTVGLGLLVGTVVTVCAAVAPARRATKVLPVEALRDEQPRASHYSVVRLTVGLVLSGAGVAVLLMSLLGPLGPVFIAVGVVGAVLGLTTFAPAVVRPLAWAIGAPLTRRGVSGDLARENAMRNPHRTASTAMALVIGLALVAGVSVFASSLKASFGEILSSSMTADLYLRAPSEASEGFSPEVSRIVRTVPGVASVSDASWGQGRIDDTETNFSSIDPATAAGSLDLGMVDGEVSDLADDGVLVFEDVAVTNSLQVGDTIPATFPGSDETQLTVSGIYRDKGFVGSDYVISLGTQGRYDPDFLVTNSMVTLGDGEDIGVVEDRISEAIADRPDAVVLNQEEFEGAMAGFINQLLGLVTVLLLLAVVIALLGIVNTLALSVFERTRELGLLRAVGMTRGQVRSMVRWEAVVISLIGAVIGSGLGIALGLALVRAVADQGIAVVRVPTVQLLFYVAAAAVAGVVAAIGPARRASKVDVLRAVTTE